MTVDISGASDEGAVLSALQPPPAGPPDDVLASRHLESGRYGNLLTALAQLARKPIFILAVVYVLFVIISAIFPSWFSTGQPYATYPSDIMQSPSLHNLFGTDELGRDMLSRLIYGGRVSLLMGVVPVLIASTIGATVTPWMVFFQQSASADKGMTRRDVRHGRLDTIAGGALINLAFMLALHSRAGARHAAAEADRRGHAHYRGGIVAPPLPQSAAVMALTLGAGAVMVLAGYAAAHWSWMLLVALIVVGGLAILAAFALLVRS